MMRLLAFLPAFLLVFLALPAAAQYRGPAVEACRTYALKEAAREGMSIADVVLERDGALALERYSRKVGSQPVSSILTGNGAVVMQRSPSAELSFICLLADEKRPVFFNWMPRQDISSLSQCRRSEALRAKPGDCLQLLLRTAEMDLTQAYALGLQQANERGEESLAAFRKANEAWRQYRDAECARRRGQPPAGVAADDMHTACLVELTRRRVLDMR